MRAPTIIIAASLAGGALAQSSSILRTSRERPSSAARLPGDLVGMSLESDRWNDWTGSLSHPNDFTYTLLDNLKQKTGVAWPIRIGGSTEDHLIWSEDVNGVENTFAPVPDNFTTTKELFPECSEGKIGGDWFLLSGNLPEGTSVIWGVNFAANSFEEALTQVRGIREAFLDPRLESVTLESIEIGNEVDYWGGQYRPENWTINAYVDQYNDFVEGINDAIGSNDLRYQVGSFSGTWEGPEIDATDIFQSTLGESTNSFSEHRYSNIADFTTRSPSIWPALRSQLITKSYIRGNLTQFGISAKYFHEHGLRYYLGETNTMFGHGMPGVSNSAASSLWVIDYALHAATLGINTLHFHAGVGYNYSAFQPVDYLGRNITDYDPDARRYTAPLYFGFMAIADAVGKHGDAWISETDVDDDHVAAYSIFDGSGLARIMLINSYPWETGVDEPRSTIYIEVLGTDLSKAKLKRLFIPSLGALSGLTWGAELGNHSGHVKGEENFEAPGTNGTVRLEASSVVLLYL